MVEGAEWLEDVVIPDEAVLSLLVSPVVRLVEVRSELLCQPLLGLRHIPIITEKHVERVQQLFQLENVHVITHAGLWGSQERLTSLYSMARFESSRGFGSDFLASTRTLLELTL